MKKCKKMLTVLLSLVVVMSGAAAGVPWGAKEIQSTKADGIEEESR